MDKQNSGWNGQAVSEQMREATCRGVEQSYALSKQILDAWATGAEATLKASFDLQNAAIAAGRTLMGPADSPNQALYTQWNDAVRLAQQATLDALNATRRLTGQFEPKTEAKEAPAK